MALAWLLSRHPFVVPIPGTRQRELVDENAAAAAVPLSADDVASLDALAAVVAGNRYDDGGMAMVCL